MNHIEAREIAKIYCDGHKIDGIKALRYQTALGLIAAKEYLERFSSADILYMQLCDDFVQNKTDMLNALRHEMAQLQNRIELLEQEIEMETEAEMQEDQLSLDKDLEHSVTDDLLGREIDRITDSERLTEAERFDA